jgi:hypothetical protein
MTARTVPDFLDVARWIAAKTGATPEPWEAVRLFDHRRTRAAHWCVARCTARDIVCFTMMCDCDVHLARRAAHPLAVAHADLGRHPFRAGWTRTMAKRAPPGGRAPHTIVLAWLRLRYPAVFDTRRSLSEG